MIPPLLSRFITFVMILGSPLAEAHAVTVVKQREFVEAAGRPVVLIIGFYI